MFEDHIHSTKQSVIAMEINTQHTQQEQTVFSTNCLKLFCFSTKQVVAYITKYVITVFTRHNFALHNFDQIITGFQPLQPTFKYLVNFLIFFLSFSSIFLNNPLINYILLSVVGGCNHTHERRMMNILVHHVQSSRDFEIVFMRYLNAMEKNAIGKHNKKEKKNVTCSHLQSKIHTELTVFVFLKKQKYPCLFILLLKIIF